MPGEKNEKKLDLVLEKFYNRYNKFNIKVLKKLAATIAKFDGITPSEAHILAQELKYNGSIDKLIEELSQLSGKSAKEVDDFLDYVAKENVEFAEEYYKSKDVEYVEYNKNTRLKDYVNTIKEQTNGTFKNLANSKNIGFSLKRPDGTMIFRPIKKVYNDLIDEAVFNVTTGVTDYKSAMRNTIKQLADSGVKVHEEKLEYETGYSIRIDSAVRQNVMNAVKKVNIGMQEKVGEDIGADGVQISAHPLCALDHLDYQGKQYTINKYSENGRLIKKGEFEKLNDEILDRPIAKGMYNCRHFRFPIVMGVNKPLYTKEQLEEYRKESLRPVIYNGKEYTAYEATQIQRKIERDIRKQKDRQIVARTSGNQDEARIAQAKINELTTKYNNFSNKAKIPTYKGNLTVSGYRRIKA